jgi:BTB/POZ domain
VREREDPQAQINSATSPVEPFEVPDANLIIRSSDFVDFRVHKSILAMASPFFKDLLSLPQPSDSKLIDGLPVVQLSEGSELLNSLFSILYPVPTAIPSSYEKVPHSFLACRQQLTNRVL